MALASEVLKHTVVAGVMAVRVRVRVVVVGEDRVGVRPLRVTPCHVVGLLLKAKQTRRFQDDVTMRRSRIISRQRRSNPDTTVSTLMVH